MLKFGERETIAGVPITLILYYYSGTLEMISVTFASKHFSEVVGALTEKYGEATVKTEAVNYRIGAAFENRTHSWHRGNARLEAKLYAGYFFDQSSVMYRTDFAIQEFARRRPFIGQGKGEGFVADGTAYRFEYERRLSGEAQSRPLPSHGLSELWMDP